ncbi:MAG: YggS family pyridoxal phosphate-dependent enzyme [Chloroflexi bacterium]|nr:YggS family pyridoxal phosphate-dependent enzyme [Chloroflexota bacterium]
MELAERLHAVRTRIERAVERSRRTPSDVTLVAVTKTVAPADMEQAFRLGVRHFGENRVQEAEQKLPVLAYLRSRTTWHLVGHLQTNKVKKALALFDMVHGVDSIHLAQEISRRATRPVPVLLEVNVAGEASKFGFRPEDLPQAAQAVARLSNFDLRGLMTVAPLTGDPESARPVFRRLRELRDALGLHDLSMGMSDDFETAIEEGATLVRIGRAIFGERLPA